MSINSLLNQTITHYPNAGKDRYGRDLDGSGTSYNARFQYASDERILPNGQVVTIDAIVYVAPDVTVNVDDRIDYGGERYRVHGKSTPVDMNGNTHHIKLKLTKWVI